MSFNQFLMRVVLPAGAALMVLMAYRAYGWAGVALAAGGLLFWLLLHFTRMMQVLKRAANRPVGYVDSAVVLNSKLRQGVNLLHVVGLTRALGKRLSDEGAQPEVFRWVDNGESHVTCTFSGGRLVSWELWRPAP
jgi:hypothetical protein